MKILFICSANKQRSKTAEDYFSERYPQFEFESAGTNIVLCRKLGTNELTDDLLMWADKIYAMESKHSREVANLFGKEFHHKIEVMNIPDRYKYMQKELISLLSEKVKF